MIGPGLMRAPGLAPSTCTKGLCGMLFTVASAFPLSADLTQQGGSGAKASVLAHVRPLLLQAVIANVLLVKVLMPKGIAMTNSTVRIACFFLTYLLLLQTPIKRECESKLNAD